MPRVAEMKLHVTPQCVPITLARIVSLALIFCMGFGVIGTAAPSKKDPSPQKRAVGSETKDLAAIIALEQRDIQASKADDVRMLVSLWTDDGVLLQPGSDPIVGIAAIRELLEQEKAKNGNATHLGV